MPADEALKFLAEALDTKEIEAYKHALLIWATKTAQASKEDAEACLPPKPVCLQDEWGE